MNAETVLARLKERELLCGASDTAALSLIEAARVRLLGYCNIPLKAEMPEGLAEVWCSLTALLLADGYPLGVTSVTEGDVSVKFGGGETLSGCLAQADRFRRMVL